MPSVNIPVCPSLQNIHTETNEEAHLQELKVYIIEGCPHTKEEVVQGIRPYWPIRNGLAMIDGIVRKDKRLIIPFQLWKQILH